MNEIWKDIPGYEGKYQTSNMGRIRSLNYHRQGITVVLKTRLNNKGYPIVNLYKFNKMTTFSVHYLVWISFNGPVPDGLEINHIDENPRNSCLENLNLLTHKENTNWGTRNERAGKSISKLMKNGPLSKPVGQYSMDGELIKVFPSVAEVERQTGFKSQNIWRCCAGIRPTSHDYKWKYV